MLCCKISYFSAILAQMKSVHYACAQKQMQNGYALVSFRSLSTSVPEPTDLISTATKKHYLAVCVPAMFLYTDWLQLGRFLEFWHNSGVTKFYLYVRSVSVETKLILDMYINEGLVEIVPFPELPVLKNGSINVNLNLHYTGQLITLNDCALRARNSAKFVAFIDLDETVLHDEKHTNFDVVHALQRMDNATTTRNVGSFAIPKEAVFRKMPKNATRLALNSFGETFCDSNYTVRKYNHAPKYIARPETAFRLHVHNVEQYEKKQFQTGHFAGLTLLETRPLVILNSPILESEISVQSSSYIHPASNFIHKNCLKSLESFAQKLSKHFRKTETIPFNWGVMWDWQQNCSHFLRIVHGKKRICFSVYNCKAPQPKSIEWVKMDALFNWTVLDHSL